MGSHQITLSSSIYIEKEDFSQEYIKDFYRFMPDNKVRLRYGDENDFYQMESYNLESKLLEIKSCDLTGVNIKKIKGCIHWISDSDEIEAKFELFTELAPNGIFNPESKITKIGYIQKYVLEILDKSFQLERKGFFKFDRYDKLDNKEIPVFIQIVNLFDNNKI